jgi:hypothetical protein
LAGPNKFAPAGYLLRDGQIEQRFLASLGMTDIGSERLFDDDAEEFFLPGSQEKFAGLIEIDLLPKIIYDHTVDFDTLLLDQPFGLAF